MSSFSRDVVRKIIIEEYEKSMYNVQHTFYKNKTKRQECLKRITNIVNEFCGISTTDEDVKKKINGLRTQFFNEISKEKKKVKQVEKVEVNCISQTGGVLNY
jgi:protein gp37